MRSLKISKEKWIGLAFVSPALLAVALLLAYPLVSNVFFSFTSKHLIRDGYKFVGLDNYIKVLTDKSFYHSLGVSVRWTAMSILCQLIVGFMAALALNSIRKGQVFYRIILVIPWAFPMIVIAITWKWLLNDVYGFLPALLQKIGLVDSSPQFFANPRLTFWTLLFINTWFGAPLMMVNILAALQTIPRDLYEAAVIDGASVVQSFWHITIRYVRHVIGLLLVLRTVWVFNNFDMIYLITGGGPSNHTTTLPIHAYIVGWGNKLLGRASAVTTLILVFLMIVSFLYFKVLNRWEKEDVR